MVENGFYKVDQSFIDLIKSLGGIYKDTKERPIFCCLEDLEIKNLFWCIPTSDFSHRNPKQIERIKNLCVLKERDIRWSYYFIGHTNRKAIYRISSCFPITQKYITGKYVSKGKHLILQSKNDIKVIRKKLARILLTEKINPNKFEQNITSIKNYLLVELGYDNK